MRYSLPFLVVALFICAPARAAIPCTDASKACNETLEIISGMSVSLFRTFPLTETNAALEAAIVVIHGVNRNADEYFAGMIKAARTVGELDRTLIISPHFKTADDAVAKNELYWESGWKRGDPSVTFATQVSSFEVMDKILQTLADKKRFAHLKRVVVTGHSAGGQFTGRYAAGSRVENEATEIDFHYVVANPSTYLYLNEERAMPGSLTQFTKVEGTSCKEYDDYAYGLKKRNAYMQRVSDEQVTKHLTRRRLTVFVGEADVEVELLDLSCGANLQGKNRFERGVTYFHYLERLLSPSTLALVTVPRVGHDFDHMYNSREGLAVLFGR